MSKVSLVVTVLNEEEHLDGLLSAIDAQTRLPDEVVIVDGGSEDGTRARLEAWRASHPSKQKKEQLSQGQIKLINKDKANISKGRNIAISKASHPLIAITDAGCIPQKDWLEQLMVCSQENERAVIAGYYKGLPDSPFQEAVVPYVLVMPDKVNPNTFLPASRSVLLEKKVWKEVGGFDEILTVSEDFVFAHKLIKHNKKIVFCEQAIVGWLPRKNLESFKNMVYKQAYFDTIAGVTRTKAKLVIARHTLGLLMTLGIALTISVVLALQFAITALLAYSFWSIYKNYRYAPKGWYWLPVLQLTADMAVTQGTLTAYQARLRRES